MQDMGILFIFVFTTITSYSAYYFMIRILVLIDPSTFSRRFLTGLINYANENGPWLFYRLPSYYKTLYRENGIINKINEWKIDAIIAQWEDEEVDFLEHLEIPVFLQGFKNVPSNFSKIAGNYENIGIMAARFFGKRNFKHFAFYGNKGFYWSRARGEGFRLEVEKLGGTYHYFESEMLDEIQWSSSHIELANWLLSLPKPIALFACDDNFALQVSEMCNVNNINIPNELVLLGVDNDELICNLSHPTISSIVTSEESEGYNTGKKLHELTIGKENIPFNIFIEPTRIELRQSTEKYNISDPHIRTVIAFIEAHVTSVVIHDLIRLVPLSRRSLEKKFKEVVGSTIYQFILDKKIEYISNELLLTDKDLLDIALDAGFNDTRSVYRIFKTNLGYSPINYRKKFSQLNRYRRH